LRFTKRGQVKEKILNKLKKRNLRNSHRRRNAETKLQKEEKHRSWRVFAIKAIKYSRSAIFVLGFAIGVATAALGIPKGLVDFSTNFSEAHLYVKENIYRTRQWIGVFDDTPEGIVNINEIGINNVAGATLEIDIVDGNLLEGRIWWDGSCELGSPYRGLLIEGRISFGGAIAHAVVYEFISGRQVNYFEGSLRKIVNSTYGKTAQGLRERRVYDLRAADTRRLEKSSITNPAYAAFITSICRGVLGEIMNALPPSVQIFSVTTDGFLTTATDEQMRAAAKGVLGEYYRRSRQELNGSGEIYEVKHIIRRPVGWRTRAQATLEGGTQQNFQGQNIQYSDDTAVVLAKGGIKLNGRMSKAEQNKEIIELYFNREPGQVMEITLGSGIREMYEEGTDFVDKEMVKKLSMEFDWKRRPIDPRDKKITLSNGNEHTHLSFETLPWISVQQFNLTRVIWQQYQKSAPRVLKTKLDLSEFAAYLESILSLDTVAAKYIAKSNGVMKRLRREVVIAHKLRKAGTHRLLKNAFGIDTIHENLKLTAKNMTTIFEDCFLIPTKETDVENARRTKVFTPHQVPNTAEAREMLKAIKDQLFPDLQIDEFLADKPAFQLIGPSKEGST